MGHRDPLARTRDEGEPQDNVVSVDFRHEWRQGDWHERLLVLRAARNALEREMAQLRRQHGSLQEEIHSAEFALQVQHREAVEFVTSVDEESARALFQRCLDAITENERLRRES